MSDDESFKKNLQDDLSRKMGQAIQAYAQEHGLSVEEVRQAALSLLITPEPLQE